MCVEKDKRESAKSKALLFTLQPNASHFDYWHSGCLSWGDRTPRRHKDGALGLKKKKKNSLSLSFSLSIFFFQPFTLHLISTSK